METAQHGYDKVDFADGTDRSRVVVEWLMSSLCNYNCSYCPDALHDGRVRYPKWETVHSFVRRLCEHYGDSDRTFLLTGGEVTTYRQLVPLMKLLRELNCAVALLSNGSKPVSWWEDRASLVDEVLLSYHHERADDDHMLAVANILRKHALVQFNVVIDPSNFDRTVAFGLRAMAESDAVVNFKIMFEDGWRRPTNYTDRQHEILTDSIARATRQNARNQEADSRASVLKGDMLVSGRGMPAQRASALEIIDRGMNSWMGWQCDVGLTTLFVRFDEIWRASCRVGGVIGSIYDEQLHLPNEPVLCTRNSCNCIAGIKSCKASPIFGSAHALLPLLTD
jgi:organic radical activating enzyme